MRGTGALESLIPVVVVPAGLIPVPNTEEGVVPVGVVVVGVVPVGVVGVVPVWLNKAKHHHININLKTMLHYDKIKKEKKANSYFILLKVYLFIFI